MRNSLARELKYLEGNNANGDSFLAETWTDITRSTDPSENIKGKNNVV